MDPERLNILFIASEADPLIKVGGLADVAGSLPSAIHELSSKDIIYDIRLAIPFYGAIKENLTGLKKVNDFKLHTGSLTLQTSVFEHELNGIPVYLINGLPIKEKDPVYGTNILADAEKFLFFSLVCLELPRILKWKIDILHANDWHTAIAIHQLSKLADTRQGYSKIKKIITLHNLAYMGAGSESALEKFGIEPSEDPTLPVWARTIPLPMGLSGADRIVPVSPTYSQEILTSEYGCGLEKFFSSHKNKITGILNGIDNTVWNPASDQLIDSQFEKNKLAGKKLCKRSLESEFGFEEKDHTPLIVLISRMDRQKGVDLAIEALNSISDLNWRAIILGSGDPVLENSALDLESRFPAKVRTKILFDSALSHRMYAGADILFMPSRYEPCGLSQLIAMRYGTIPVARATGGLKDTILNLTKGNNGTGFVFSDASAGEASIALIKAIETYQSPPVWKKIVNNAMAQDFSWTESAKKYCSLYKELTLI